MFTSPSQQVTVRVKAMRDSVTGMADLSFPQGWTATGDDHFFIARKGEEKMLNQNIKNAFLNGIGIPMLSNIFNLTEQEVLVRLKRMELMD